MFGIWDDGFLKAGPEQGAGKRRHAATEGRPVKSGRMRNKWRRMMFAHSRARIFNRRSGREEWQERRQMPRRQQAGADGRAAWFAKSFECSAGDMR
ncbi:hypothetical protein CLG96_05385 [Sphingomonas oleivorans]|uniref:Uncharacterized protein n=1 Tax=Sphingomonas oleivorans TaxID=1735121 RepID=A0A2T5FZ90_9SPHN|nr:hypothetical protein CLG96_05385 [Sphingomonas oleivorans]